MEKVDFLNLIEGYYNIQLTKPQLQYFFTGSRNVAMSSPRRGGKSFIANMDSLYTCTIPNKSVAIVFPSETQAKLAKEEIINMTDALIGYIHVLDSVSNYIRFSNGSKIYLLIAKNFDDGSKGCRFNKVTIEEPDHISNDIESIEQRAGACMCINEDAQLKIVGTHGTVRHNLAAYLLNPYFESITVTLNNTHLNYSRERLVELSQEMREDLFFLEILNQITPSMLNKHLTSNE